jgi:ketosteroid isomerase-like protein
MSQENVDIVRRSLDAFNRRDRTAWLALCDPEYQAVPIADWPETDPTSGPEAAWDVYVEADEQWEASPYEVVKLIDAENGQVVAHLIREMRGKASGVGVTYDYWLVSTVRNGKVRRTDFYEDEPQALAAVGLSA